MPDDHDHSLGDADTLGDSGFADDLLDAPAETDGWGTARGPSETLGAHETLPESMDLDQGRLTLVKQLGEGGMGVVWLARDNELRRLVAIKRPKGFAASVQTGRRRFMREARAAASLDHPNIVTVYRVQEDDTGPFIEMEYVAGHSLAAEAGSWRKGLPIEKVSALGRELCSALVFAHEKGIIHRDIKPLNVLLTKTGCAKLADFGLAAAREEKPDVSMLVTKSGEVLGTMYYAAPEQLVDAAAADKRSDLYSLAATLYFALTCRSPRSLRFDLLPPAIRPVLERALEEDPSDRFETVAEFAAAWQESVHKAERVFTVGDATCPTCHANNPLTFRRCVQCGGDLAALFKPCPSLDCEAEYRVDQEHCHECGAHIPSETLLRKIEEAGRQYDYERVDELSSTGMHHYPKRTIFAEKHAWAKEKLALSEDLLYSLEHATNDSQRLILLQELLALQPNEPNRREQYERLESDKDGYEKELERLKASREHTQAADIVTEALARFPEQPAFHEICTWVSQQTEATKRLEQQLASAQTKGGRLAVLQQLVQLDPHNDKWRTECDCLERELGDLQTSVRNAQMVHLYRKVVSIASTGLLLFPEDKVMRTAMLEASYELSARVRLTRITKWLLHRDRRPFLMVVGICIFVCSGVLSIRSCIQENARNMALLKKVDLLIHMGHFDDDKFLAAIKIMEDTTLDKSDELYQSAIGAILEEFRTYTMAALNSDDGYYVVTGRQLRILSLSDKLLNKRVAVRVSVTDVSKYGFDGRTLDNYDNILAVIPGDGPIGTEPFKIGENYELRGVVNFRLPGDNYCRIDPLEKAVRLPQ